MWWAELPETGCVFVSLLWGVILVSERSSIGKRLQSWGSPTGDSKADGVVFSVWGLAADAIKQQKCLWHFRPKLRQLEHLPLGILRRTAFHFPSKSYQVFTKHKLWEATIHLWNPQALWFLPSTWKLQILGQLTQWRFHREDQETWFILFDINVWMWNFRSCRSPLNLRLPAQGKSSSTAMCLQWAKESYNITVSLFAWDGQGRMHWGSETCKKCCARRNVSHGYHTKKDKTLHFRKIESLPQPIYSDMQIFKMYTCWCLDISMYTFTLTSTYAYICAHLYFYMCAHVYFWFCFCGMALIAELCTEAGVQFSYDALHISPSCLVAGQSCKILQAKNHASLAKASCIHTGSCTWPLCWRHVFSRPNRPNRNVMAWDLPNRLLTIILALVDDQKRRPLDMANCRICNVRPCCTEKFHEKLYIYCAISICRKDILVTQIVPAGSRSGLLVPGTLSSSSCRSAKTAHDVRFVKRWSVLLGLRPISDVVRLGIEVHWFVVSMQGSKDWKTQLL